MRQSYTSKLTTNATEKFSAEACEHLGDELDRALASEEIVVGDAADGDHGEAAVLDLLDL